MRTALTTRATFLLATLLAALTLGLPATHADTVRTMTAGIPFDFVVKGQEMPSGTYNFRVYSSGRVQLLDQETGRAANLFTVDVSGDAPVNEGQIVFRSSGPQYVLSEVWLPGDSDGHAVPLDFDVRTSDEYERVAIVLTPFRNLRVS